MGKLKSIIFHLDAIPAIAALEPAEAGALFLAILRHANGEEVDRSALPKAIAPLFMMFSAQIDRDKARYDDVCKKRAEAGQKGGKQKLANLANASNSSKALQSYPKSKSKSKSNIIKETSLTRGKETPGAFSLSADESAPLAQSALNPKAVSFKHWTKEQLKNAVNECIASRPEYSGIAADFVDYWYEPTASGKPRLWLQDAWDTCRRLRTWALKEQGYSVAARPVSGHSAIPEPFTPEYRELQRRQLEAF